MPERNINAQPVSIRNDFVAKLTLHTVKHLKLVVVFLEIHLLNGLISTVYQKIVMGRDADIALSVEKHLKEL